MDSNPPDNRPLVNYPRDVFHEGLQRYPEGKYDRVIQTQRQLFFDATCLINAHPYLKLSGRCFLSNGYIGKCQ